MRILGVDYSGAITDRHTWLADGLLHEDELVLRGCRPVTRAELTETLADQTEPTVAALDFPFSVPRPFAHYWQPDASTMPQLWAAAAAMDLPEFMALRDRFVAGWGELKRWADTFYPECYSCLHKANPNLVPMTFRGTQMLDRLWGAGCSVPPLAAPAPARSHERTVLLEAMPGAALKALRLPYKGYKKGSGGSSCGSRSWRGCRSAYPSRYGTWASFKTAACRATTAWTPSWPPSPRLFGPRTRPPSGAHRLKVARISTRWCCWRAGCTHRSICRPAPRPIRINTTRRQQRLT